MYYFGGLQMTVSLTSFYLSDLSTLNYQQFVREAQVLLSWHRFLRKCVLVVSHDSICLLASNLLGSGFPGDLIPLTCSRRIAIF